MLALGLGVTSSLTSVEALARGGFSANGVLPRLALDFDNNSYVLDTGSVSFDAAFTAGSPKLTYSTTSNSTMVNSSGNIVWAPHNLVTYSEDFSNAAWGKFSGGVIVADAATSPDGTTNASQFYGTDEAHIIEDVSATPGTTYSYSVFVKTNGTNVLTVALNFRASSSLGYFGVDINTATGAISGPALGTQATASNVENLGNGWFRLSITQEAPSTTTTARVFMANKTDADASSSDGYLIYGAQLNRSDLGGMGQVPGAATGFEYYVPTSGSAKYLPRVGHHVYNGSSFVNEGLLIESEARTNLVTYSEDFTNASWSKSRGSAVLDAVGPDGVTNSAATFTDNGATGTNTVYIGEDFTVSTSTAYTFSIFAKADQLSHIHIRAVNFTTPAEGGVFFDLSAGTVGTANAGLTGEIEDFGNGWHRCAVTFTTDAADTTGSIRVFLANGESLFIDLDGTSSVLLYGAQLDQGKVVSGTPVDAPTPSSYIPTSGSTVTRAAQSLAVPPAAFGWNNSAVSIQMEGRITFADQDEFNAHQFVRWREDSNNFISLHLGTNTGDGGRYFVQQREGGTDVDSVASGIVFAAGVLTPFNVASRHGTTFLNGAVGGAALTANTTPTALPDLSATTLQIAHDFMGTVRQFVQYDADIGDTGLEKATS